MFIAIIAFAGLVPHALAAAWHAGSVGIDTDGDGWRVIYSSPSNCAHGAEAIIASHRTILRSWQCSALKVSGGATSAAPPVEHLYVTTSGGGFWDGSVTWP